MRANSPIPDTGTMDERGVSEVLSFVLVFGIILSSVVVVGMVGFDSIQSYQQLEQQGNAERAMNAFADNANDIVRYDGVNRRAGDLTLREGVVDPGASGSEMNVSVHDGGDELWNSSGTYGDDIGAFTYESESGTIAYEGGAVFREATDGTSVMRTDPMVTCRDDDIAMLSLVVINESEQSIQATDTVAFDIRENETKSTRTVFDDADTLTVSLNGDDGHESGWEMYFEHNGWDESSNEWSCESVERVSVDIVEVDISYPEIG
ncbi:hypothetical protein D8Y22_20465 [Salinadaptatus halalkaliphilus]|uniref:Uncharacterized protein n=1 Tax=Salinadaptatus halalkaliphilus TaxID=2419781 RepID=A0A4V3VKS2_9EURY|nr:hypothetical protein [Salinadaptatus halalkaliphilus]THE62837.1 hypothetical protein D8Y22_20465 [Salinadaptatus halalkaliphilus]